MRTLILSLILSAAALSACAPMTDLSRRDPDTVRRCGAVPQPNCENGL